MREKGLVSTVVYEGKVVFVCLFIGKSLCYQTLPFVLTYKQAKTSNSAVSDAAT